MLTRIKRLYCWLRAVFADSIYNRMPVILAYFLLRLTLIIVRRIAGGGFILVQPLGGRTILRMARTMATVVQGS
ncbi:hypothetical protein ACW7BJ_33095 [Azospirillum argentinense]